MRPLTSPAAALAASLLVALAAPGAEGQDLPLETFAEAEGPLRAKLRQALYEDVEVLGEKALSPRPVAEAKTRLDALAGESPAAAPVQRYLGKALASTGDHAAAIAAMRRAEELETEAAWPLEDEADYLGSRGDARGQLAALLRLAKRRRAHLDRPGERDQLAAEYREMAELVEAHRIPRQDALQYRRLAAELEPRSAYGVITWLVDQGRVEDALAQMAWARRLLPEDSETLASDEVSLLGRLGRLDDAREVMRREVAGDDGIEDSWLWGTYVGQLRAAERLESELRRVRAAVAAAPVQGFELAEATVLLEAAGASEEAGAALDRALEAADRASDEEVLVLAALLCRAGRYDEGSRLLYALAATAPGEARHRAEARLARLLARGHGMASPSGLPALLDDRHLDPGPGLLSGGLSLLLGGPPGGPGGGASRTLARFDRDHVRAARSVALVEDLRRRSPRGSEEVAVLELELIATYRSYGATGTAYAAAERFLDRYPRSGSYFSVGTTAAELAEDVGEDPLPILRRLARDAQEREDDRAHRMVLGRIESFLSDRRRWDEVVAAYSSAIDARPDDARLYDSLLAFLATHNLHDEEERVHRRALARFEGGGWAARYARWLTRQRGVEAHRALTRRLLDELGPSELAGYLGETVSFSFRTPDDDASRFFLEVYREALRRHPGELALARRLLDFYGQNLGRYGAERRALLVRYAPYDPAVRETLYGELAASGRLDESVDALAAGTSEAALLLAADYLVRRARHERAREALRALAASRGDDRAVGLALASLEVSLDARARGRAVVAGLLRRYPADATLLTRAGELAIEEEDLEGARGAWDRIPAARVGDPEAYLAAATLYWDYAMFEDASRTLLAARTATGEEDLYAFQLAAVHESAGDRQGAAEEYLRVLAAAATRAERWPPSWLGRGETPETREPEGDEEYDEYGYDDGYGGGADPALMHVWSRLSTLARRDGDAEVVERVVTAALTAAPDDPGLLHVRVDLLEATGQWDEGDRLLAREAVRLPSRSIRERAIDRLVAAGMEDEATRVLERLVAARPDDGEPVYRLAAHLERRGHVRQAAAALTAFADRIRPSEARRSDLVEVESRLARMLYAHGRFDEALAAAGRAIALLDGRRQRSLRLMAGGWLLRLERGEAADAMVRPILETEPDDPDALDLAGRALVAVGLASGAERRQVVERVQETYRSAIDAARERAMDGDDARYRVRELRVRAIALLDELGAPRAALDHYVMLLNDDLESAELALRAYRYAAAHDLVESLEARYRRDEARSPRDHRLPLVLARLAAARGDLRAAAEAAGRSLAIAPERLDLRQERLAYLLRDRAWAEAAAEYGRLGELEEANGESPTSRIASEADMYGRLGDWERMGEALDRMIASDEMTRPLTRLAAARLAARHGRWDRAWAEAWTDLDGWSTPSEALIQAGGAGQTELGEVATLAVRSGHWRQAASRLARMEEAFRRAAEHPGVSSRYGYERVSSAASWARGPQLAGALARFGVDGEVSAFAADLGRQIEDAAAVGRVAPEQRASRAVALADLAGAAGATRAELALLRAIAGRSQGVDQVFVERHLMDLLAGFGAHRQIRELVEATHLPPADQARLLQGSAAALGDAETEARALEALLPRPRDLRFSGLDPALERLLVLRWGEGGPEGRRRVVALAGPRASRSGQVANFLLERGDDQGATEALERYAGGRASLWLDTARARVMLHGAERDGAPADPAPFVRALDLRPIEARVERPAKAGGVLAGARWADLAEAYGFALARAPAKAPSGAVRLDLAGIELDPASPAAHVRVGLEALTRSDPRVAEEHFALARELDPSSVEAWDGLARARLLGGQRDEALALWDGLLGSCRDEACLRRVLDSMVAAGEAEEAFSRLDSHVLREWRAGRVTVGFVRALSETRAARDRLRDGPVDRLVQGLLATDQSRTDLLAAAAGLDGAPILQGRGRGRYLREGLRRVPAGDYDRQRWVQAYADYLVAYREHRTLVDLLERYERELDAEDGELPTRLGLALVQGLLGLGRRREALARLDEVARTDQAAAIGLLRELGLDEEAFTLQLERAQAGLDAGEEARALYVSAVEALLGLGRGDEAVVLARRGAAAQPDDLPALRALASLLGEGGEPEAALLLRRTIYEIERTDFDNLLAMARLELALGQVDRARGRTLSLLGRWAVPATVEAGAAELLVRLVAEHEEQRGPATSTLEGALRSGTFDEDRALALARIMVHFGDRRGARRVLERAVALAPAPSRSLSLLARLDDEDGDRRRAEGRLERALVDARGGMEVGRQLFLVRRRMGAHRAALAAVGVVEDRPSGIRMLEGLEPREAAALCSEIADSAVQAGFWAAADAYSSEAIGRIDGRAEPERARIERARLQTIRSHVASRRAAARGRPWIREDA